MNLEARTFASFRKKSCKESWASGSLLDVRPDGDTEAVGELKEGVFMHAGDGFFGSEVVCVLERGWTNTSVSTEYHGRYQ